MDIGDRVVLHVEVTNRDGDLESPTQVDGWVKDPTVNQPVHILMTEISTGIFEGEFTASHEGIHIWRVEATGSLTTAGEKTFRVTRQKVIH